MSFHFFRCPSPPLPPAKLSDLVASQGREGREGKWRRNGNEEVCIIGLDVGRMEAPRALLRINNAADAVVSHIPRDCRLCSMRSVLYMVAHKKWTISFWSLQYVYHTRRENFCNISTVLKTLIEMLFNAVAYSGVRLGDLWSDRNFLIFFCTVFVSFVLRLNLKSVSQCVKMHPK